MKLKFLQFGKALGAALFVLLLVAVGAKKMHAENITFANVEVINVGYLNTDDLRDGLPTVTTTAVTYTNNSVISGGNVVDDGGSTVTARGICYGSLPYPDLTSTYTHTENGTGTGYFTSVIDASVTGTIYVRAYATNASGTAYGDQVTVNVDYLQLPTFVFNGLTYVVAPDPTTTSDGYISWTSANAYCENLTAYGYSDWRMPTIEELEMMYQNSTSIGGFANGYNESYNHTKYRLYHSSSLNSAGTYHLQVQWWNGTRSYRQEFENVGYWSQTTSNGANNRFYCHVRPVRVETSAPVVVTNSVTNIAPTTATFGGNVTDQGSCVVTSRGICWSTSHNPTISDSHTDNGSGTGTFASNITGLTPKTQYYVRAYATNCEGTSYGNEVSFTTISVTVTTNEVTNVTQTSATCGGYVNAYSGTTVTERGVCWSTTNQTPTTSDSHSSNGTGAGYYTINLSSLTQNTTYYVRAYAICSEGTAYGETKQFKTTKLSYRISEGGVVAVSAGGYFYDSGGVNNDYSNNENYIMTFVSNQGPCTKVQMTFIYFDLYGDQVDCLSIYDGLNTSAPLIGTYYNDDSPGTVTATNADGALTFVFRSSSSNVWDGWEAAISIVTSGNAITASAVPASGGTVTGDGCYSNGQSCTLTATPASDYSFVKWTKNGTQVSTNANYTFTVTGSASYMAHFTLDKVISVSANPTSGGSVSGGGTYSNGQSCTITATPASGYTFVKWTKNGTQVSTNASYTFTVTENASYVAHFNQTSCTVSVSASPTNGGTVSGGGTYTNGQSCTITATPATGYTFVKWTKNGTQVSTNATYSFTVTGNASYVAHFNQTSCTVSVSANPTYGGTVSGGGTYTNGQSCTITATPAAGYTFVKWTKNGTLVSTNASYTFTVTGNASYVAHFNTITAPINLDAEVNGKNVTLTWEMPSGASYEYDFESGLSGWTTFQGANADDGTSWVHSNDNPGGYDYTTHGHDGSSGFAMSYSYVDYVGSYNADNYMVSPEKYTIAAGTQLTFYYDYGNDTYPDYFTVEVSTASNDNADDFTAIWAVGSKGGNNNHAKVRKAEATRYDNWREVNIDLSAYAGQEVWIAFHHTDNDNYEVWIDDVTFTNMGTASEGVFRVYRSEDGETYELVAYNVTETTYTDENLADGTHYYQVTAINTLADGSECESEPAIDKNGINDFVMIEIVPMNYTITVTASPTNGGTVSGGGTYTNGQSCTITATPATGYTFVKWTKNGTQVSNNASYTFTVTGNESYVAHFSQNSYTITATANPTNGGTVGGGGTYTNGQSCTLTATPATGYTFVKWTKNGTQVSTNASYTFTVTGNESYVAHFSQTTSNYTVNVSANPTNGGTVTGGGSYSDGQSCTVSAAPAIGYTFVCWKENGVLVSTSTDYTFTVTGNRNLVANFSSEAYTITATANPAEGGSVSGADTYIYGITATLTATANTGYTFVKWTKNGVVVSTSATYTFTVTESGDYIANFSLNNYEITATANPTEGGTIDGADTYGYGSTATLTATANEGYHFVNWTKNGIEVSAESSYSFTVIEAGNYVANFELNSYEVTATANPAAGGTIEGADTYVYGSTATLIATPNQNYVFDNWTENGVVVSVDSSYSFTVTANRALVANFTFIDGIGEQNGIEANIYPNPTNGKITVEAENLRRVSVFNTLGQKVFEASASGNSTECNLRGCSIGVYSMQIETTSGIVTKRVVVEK